jgi:hypothetical protein
MRKLLLRILFLLGGFVAGLVAGLLLPAAQRLRLSQQLAAGIGRVAERMPDGLTVKGNAVWRAPDTGTKHGESRSRGGAGFR